MTQANSKSDATRYKSRRFAITSIIAIIILFVAQYVVITIVVPLMRGDGVNNFTDTPHEAARKAVDADRLLVDSKIRWAYVVHADDVHPTTEQEKAKYCTGSRAHVTSDSSDPHFYTVVVSTKQLFSYDRATIEVRAGCSNAPDSW